MREAALERTHHGGPQRLYRFPNGYGASVVSHHFSYGGEAGLWELAVIKYDDDDPVDGGELCYSTPVTDDVLGWLTDDDVDAALAQIEALNEGSGQ